MNWRDIGDTTFAAWTELIRRRAPTSPILAAGRAAYDAARPHSRLCLGMMWAEDRFQTDPSSRFPITNHNPMNMKTPDGAGWMRFGSYPEGIAGWRDRITSPTYKPQNPGVYARTEDLRDLIEVYAPASENDVDEYVRTVEIIVAELAAIERSQGGDPVPDFDMTRGLIPLPSITPNIIDVSARCTGDGRGWDDLGERTIRGVVLHRSQGTWDGNISHFESHCPGALTDLQVHHVDGRMMRFVDLRAPRQAIRSPAGWANGRVVAPYGDGLAFVNRYGINAVNRDLESCEITGFFAQPGETTREDPVAAACWRTLAQWIASRAHDYGIAWSDFPLIVAEGGRSFVIWHQELTIGTGKVCPGKTVMDGTAALIEQTRAIMKAAQTKTAPAPTPPSYAAPIVPDWLTEDLKDGKPDDHTWTVTIDGKRTTIEVLALHRPFRATKPANRLQLPWPGGPKVGPPLKEGERFMAQKFAKVGRKTFVLTEWGTWIDESALEPRVSFRAA